MKTPARSPAGNQEKDNNHKAKPLSRIYCLTQQRRTKAPVRPWPLWSRFASRKDEAKTRFEQRTTNKRDGRLYLDQGLVLQSLVSSLLDSARVSAWPSRVKMPRADRWPEEKRRCDRRTRSTLNRRASREPPPRYRRYRRQGQRTGLPPCRHGRVSALAHRPGSQGMLRRGSAR